MTKRDAGAESAERRRHIRTPSALPAVLAVSGDRFHRGVIKDFCPGGVFLELAGEDLRELSLNLVMAGADAAVSLHFTPRDAPPGLRLEISTRVARVLETGVGLAFVSPEPAAVQALAASVQSAAPREPKPAAIESAVSGDVVKKATQIREIAREFLDAKVHELFKSACDELFITARDAVNNQDQQACFDSIKEVEALQPQVGPAFLDAVLEQVDALASGGHDDSDHSKGDEDDGLALVDTCSFDDWLTVKLIIDRADKRDGRGEERLADRVSRAFNLNLEVDDNPCGMRAMCFAFHDAVQNLAAGKGARRAVFAAFESVVIEELQSFYTQLDAILPPAITTPTPKPAASQSRPNRGIAAAPHADQAASHEEDFTDQWGATQSSTGDFDRAAPMANDLPLPSMQNHADPGARPSAGNVPQGGSPAATLESAPFGLDHTPQDTGWNEQASSLDWDPNWDQVPGSAPALDGVDDWRPSQVDVLWPEVATSAPAADSGRSPVKSGAQDSQLMGQTGEALAAFNSGARPTANVAPGEQFDGVDKVAAPNWGEDTVPPAVNRAETSGIPARHVASDVTNSMSSSRRAGGHPRQGRALHAARNLLALRRQVAAGATPIGAALETQPEGGGATHINAVLTDLANLQASGEADAWADSGSIMLGERMRERFGNDHFEPGSRSDDALDVVSALMDAIFDDVLIDSEAKKRIGRLAVPLLRSSFDEESVLGSESHPARAVVNRLGELDLSGGGDDSHGGAALRESVDSVIQQVREQHQVNPNVFAEVLPVLDQLRALQNERVNENVARLVQAREAQESVVRALRNADGTQPADGHSGSTSQLPDGRDIPADWREQLGVAARLPTGTAVILDAGTPQARPATLAWSAEDRNQFLFAGAAGEKAASFSQQALAMALRRGTVQVADDAQMPAIERGFFRMLQDMHAKVAHESTHDPLTGLYNVKSFRDGLDELAHAALQDGSCHVICFADLDDLDELVERCGERAGQKLLVRLARLLEKHMSERGKVARLEGNRFGLLYRNSVIMEAEPLVERLRAALERSRCVFKGESLTLTISAALTAVTEDCVNVEELTATLDAACARVHDEGGNGVVIAEPPSSPGASAQPLPQQPQSPGLRELLDQDRLALRCQLVKPVAEGSTAKPFYEALLGYVDDDGEVASAGHLFSNVSADEDILDVDRWVIRQVLDWMQSNRKLLRRIGGISINLSGVSLEEDALLGFVIDQFNRTEVPPGKVMFEMAEAAAVDRLSVAQDFMRTLKEYGCRFMLDDFRAGQASFAYLKNLPVDKVKISGALVRDMVVGDDECAMVRSVNEIAHFMGKETIAELVDDERVLEKLVELGVDHAQGYCIEMPMPLRELAQVLINNTAY